MSEATLIQERERWTVVPTGTRGYYVARLTATEDGSQRQENIALVCLPHAGDMDQSLAEMKANAELLASAPQLLEACKAAADLLARCDAEGNPLPPVTDDEWDAVAQQVGEAIASANGAA